MTPLEVSAIRRMVGLTVDQFADRLDVNPRTVRGWESGKYSPSESAAQAILSVRREHDKQTDRLMLGAAETDAPVYLGGPEHPRGWWIALAARVLDANPDARVEWDD